VTQHDADDPQGAAVIARGPRRPPEGGGLAVLVVVTVLAWLAAPQAHRLRPVVDQLRRADLPALPLPRLPAPPPGAGGGRGGRVCPVAGRFTYGSGWGAPRDAGARQHQGIDLLAPAGTRLVAVEDGRIGPRWGHDGGNAGIRLWLVGDSGTHYFYAHNQRNHVTPGQRVHRGQVLAEVGTTGNAAHTPPHVHFEVHPGGGPAVNPDATVRRWCR
jgi:murein DD-endopeptidase MepM/ murein hydrolase activator NlpD